MGKKDDKSKKLRFSRKNFIKILEKVNIICYNIFYNDKTSEKRAFFLNIGA